PIYLQVEQLLVGKDAAIATVIAVGWIDFHRAANFFLELVELTSHVRNSLMLLLVASIGVQAPGPARYRAGRYLLAGAGVVQATAASSRARLRSWRACSSALSVETSWKLNSTSVIGPLTPCFSPSAECSTARASTTSSSRVAKAKSS